MHPRPLTPLQNAPTPSSISLSQALRHLNLASYTRITRATQSHSSSTFLQRRHASVVSTPADPVPAAYPEIQLLRQHPQRRIQPHNEAHRIYQRTLIRPEDLQPSPHRSRFPLRELSRERLYLRIAQLDPFTYGKDRLVWESYTAKVFQAYRAQDFDTSTGWVKQHASLRENARRQLLGLLEGDESLAEYPGLWDWDLIEWKLHRAHSNVKEWQRRRVGVTDTEMGERQQAGKEASRRKKASRVFLSDEEVAARMARKGQSVDAVRERRDRMAQARAQRVAAGVKLPRGRPRVRPLKPIKMAPGRPRKESQRPPLE
ncbi:MAG: hypothetical protein M1828_001980 [Chrysothrix sp. TS-e1954]|nr:MAG: hypothetical protein M1828_001980 [Chrysothrix sp. TS-e1954]